MDLNYTDYLMPNNNDHPLKNNQMPIPMRVFFWTLTRIFKVLGVVSPKLAGKLALRLFMIPPKFGTPKRETAVKDSAINSTISVQDRNICIRRWGDENNPRVLLSHGWGGRCLQFHAFIQPLVDAGFHVVGFDVPAHGDSEGKFTNMIDVASVIANIEKEFGPFEAIIGHSFGTGTALLAMDKFHIKANKVVLIGYFSEVKFIIKLFGDLFELRQTTLDAMRSIAMDKFSTHFGISWSWDDISPTQTIKSNKADLLLIHDDQDHEVPQEQALPLQEAAPHAKVMTTSGFGHRKILMNKDVINETVSFISK